MKKFFVRVGFLLALSLPLVSLLTPGLPLTHDGPDHVARIANFYQNLMEGSMIPCWAGNLNWGNGHPILMFLYPLPSYLASLFHFVGFSFVDSTKLVFAFGFIGSVSAMFLWATSQWGVVAGLVAAVLYGFAPYRFVDLYVRGAIGEHTAFIFPPLVLWGLLLLARKKHLFGAFLVVSVGTAGLILSHNALSLMFLPIVVLYAVYLYAFETRRDIIILAQQFAAITYGFLLSAFFWMPAFFEGKYTLRDIVTKGSFDNRYTPWSWFLYSPWVYGGGEQFSKQLGFGSLAAMIGGLWYFFRIKKRETRWFLGIAGGLTLIALFLMTKESNIVWSNISLLQKFQFPWRLLSLTTLLIALIGARVATLVPKKFMPGLFVGIVLAIVLTVPMWQSQGTITRADTYFTDIYNSTTDTGESSPIWSVRFMEHRPPAVMEVISGEASWSAGMRTSSQRQYTVTARSRARVAENTLYFPGWKVYVDGRVAPVEFQDPAYRGLMTYWLEAGTHTVVIKFESTKLRQLADMISLAGWAGILLIVVSITIRRLKKQS